MLSRYQSEPICSVPDSENAQDRAVLQRSASASHLIERIKLKKGFISMETIQQAFAAEWSKFSSTNSGNTFSSDAS
jgi:hypothetical protein